MRETTLRTLGGIAVFSVKIVGAFKMETRREQKRDLTTWIRERNGVNLTLKFTKSTGDTAGMGPRDKKDLHQT